jgi:hypothetical protein
MVTAAATKPQSELDTIAAEIAKQEAIVSQFESALQDVMEPPKYPDPSPSEPALMMAGILAQASTEREREAAIAAGKTALTQAQQHLEKLKTDQARLQLTAKGNELKPKIWESAQRLKEAIAAVDAAYADLIAAADGSSEALWSCGCEFRNTLDRNLKVIPEVTIGENKIGITSRIEAERLEASRKGAYYPREVRI